MLVPPSANDTVKLSNTTKILFSRCICFCFCFVLLSCVSRAREHRSNIHQLMVVAVLLELLCLCAMIFVALIKCHSSLVRFYGFLCHHSALVTFLIHLKDKYTPESIDAHSLTQTYPFLIIFWCSPHAFLQYLIRRCWDCCRHFWRICMVWTGTSPLLMGLLIHVVYLPFIWVSQIALGRWSTIVSCPTICVINCQRGWPCWCLWLILGSVFFLFWSC